MDRIGQRIRSKGIARYIVAVATLGMVWVAAAAPFTSGF